MPRWTEELERARSEIQDHADAAGLSFPEVIFELIDHKQINEVASYGGFPTRYPHWKFGMQYDQLSKSYTYGLSKIYEMVINNDPVYAYLMDCNELIDQKLVIAHVFGHADFFANNLYFQHTDRKMMDRTANHAVRANRFVDRHGMDAVESFIDACLSLDNLIDYQATLRGPRSPSRLAADAPVEAAAPAKLPAKGYMDSYINPPDFLAAQANRALEQAARGRDFPAEPEDDVLLFLLENAPLERWQQELLAMVRREAYYFIPQGQTKIMNEGWATFWHTRIMTSKVLDPSEIVDYADHHSGTVAMAPGQFNPYKIGLELFRDIEDRWNRGAHGGDYETCEDLSLKQRWNRDAGAGLAKIFEVRRIYNDVNFLDTFLSEEFCARLNLFTFRYNPKSKDYEIASRDFREIKRRLLFQLTRLGNPWIQVVNGNADNRGELLLRHRHEGVDLEPAYMEATLANLCRLWTRPVQLVTLMDETPALFRHDGRQLKTQKLDSP